MVRFDPSRSQITVHIQQKASWYRKVLREFIDIIGAQPEFIFPYEVGGETYRIAADLFAGGYEFEGVDGFAWDTSVGIILGPAFWAWMSYFHNPKMSRGYFMLDSGITPTSMFGTLANIAYNRNSKGTILALGDDMNHWKTEPGPSIASPIAEVAVGDTLYWFVLGLSFKDDPYMPRLCGLKTSMDRAGKMQPVATMLTTDLQFEEYLEDPAAGLADKTGHGYKRSREMRATWAGGYHGWFGPDPFLDVLRKVKADDFIAPGQLIEQLILEGQEKDAYAWAEKMGIKALFL